MKDSVARTKVEELEKRLENLEEKTLVAHHCPKCARSTAHEHIYVRTLLDGTRCETSAALSSCIGLNIEPGRRCLSCGAVYVLTEPFEVQLKSKDQLKIFH